MSMEALTCQKLRNKVSEKPKQEGQLSALAANNSPPSSSSSPAHEFSFTISLHQQPPSSTTTTTKSPPSYTAVDLSPADDIFFHGHLLPLHLLSHLPVSPRSSTNSLDSFTLPITELYPNNDHTPQQQHIDIISPHDDPEITKCYDNNNINECNDIKGRVKSKSFSIFGLPKWRKGYEIRDKEDKERDKKKLKFDVSDVLKRYMKMVRPLLSFRGSRKSMNRQFHQSSYSFSGSMSSRGNNQEQFRGRRGQISAPASMRTSPTNSGLLVATGALASSTSTDSTMEELQAAIQAAITHCKNSIGVEDKIN